MKRFLSLLVAAALFSTLLAGCGPQTDSPSGAGGTDAAAPTQTETTGPAQPLAGASVVLKLSHGDNDTSMLKNTWNCYARVLKKSIELYSDGEMTLEIYPNDSLGSTTSCLEQCSQGTIDIALSAAVGALAGWVPDVSVFDMPYLIDDIDVCNLVCEGEIRDELSAELESAANMRLLSLIQTDFRNLDTWKAPVRSLADMSGMKMRVQEIDPHIAMVESWGAVPSSVAFTELYSAASTGVIDCYENCNYTLFMNNLYETVKYITETKHAANVCICAMSNACWDKLTPEQQDVILRAEKDARRATSGVVAANNVDNIDVLESSGIEIISLTDEERAAFRGACFEAGKAAAMSKVDPAFYDRFTKAYDDAAKLMGRA